MINVLLLVQMKDSELQDNDWIRIYLELAVATTDRNREASDFGLSNLEIVDVAIDANDEEGLNARNATFYIRYKDLYKARLGKDFDRIAIVRRSFDEDTGCFSLVGQNQSSDIIPKKRKIANEDTGCFSLKGQNQSSEIIQFGQGYGVYKPFAENKRIKLNLTGLPNQISSPLATCEDHEDCESSRL